MNWWEHNRQILQQRFPHIHTLVQDIGVPDTIQSRPAANGSISVAIKESAHERLLHSVYNPEEESQRFINAFNLTHNHIPLVLGFGLGYHVETLCAGSEDFSHIFVCEARPDIFKAALCLRNLAPLLLAPRLRLFVDANHAHLMQALMGICGNRHLRPRLRFIVHQPSLTVYKNTSSELTDIVEKTHLSPRLQNMLRENFLANMETTIESPGVNTLFGAARNKPVFLISAGPTLTRDLDLVRQAQGRAVMLSVSTCFRLLMDNGIHPDYVAIGDPKAIMLSHFENLLDSAVPLIFLPTAAKEVVRAYRGPKIVALQNEYQLSDFVSSRIEKGRVDVGESVSTLILDIGIKMGGNPLIFIGQDLAFTDGHSHADGIQKRLKINTAPRTITSITGEEIPSSSVFYWFKHWIEKRISREADRLFINTSQTGARIAGTTALPLRDVIAQYCS
ncbi:MAG: DUF115 domain-containing protein [Candidatus Omnitrophica bacterium]|nr:DUF115 domain-containing protein [Candidatus Omnitrophota bacterium]